MVRFVPWGHWQIDLAGSSFDTLLAVYTGSALSTLSMIAYNDDCSTTNSYDDQSCATLGATEGTLLYIQVCV